MTDTSHEEFAQFPVESIARFLSVCGNEDPTLLRRSRTPPSHEPQTSSDLKASRKDSGDAFAHDDYLEELVSIAVASARQAEDAARQVRAATASARRRMFAISAFGAVGVLTGVAGIGSMYLRTELPWAPANGPGKVAAASPGGTAPVLMVESLPAPAMPGGGSASARPPEPHLAEAMLYDQPPAPPVDIAAAQLPADTAVAKAQGPQLYDQPPAPPVTPPVAIVSAQPTPKPAIATAQPPELYDQPPAPPVAPPLDVASVQPPMPTAPTASTAPSLPAPDSAEATEHANAGAWTAMQAAVLPPSEPAPPPTRREETIASATPAPPASTPTAAFVPPLPVPPNAASGSEAGAGHAGQAHSAPTPLARVRAAAATTASQLVAAVQALEALTDEQPAAPSRHTGRRQVNNRM